MYIVTSGSKYLDIDAYAGIIAYAEFFRINGISAQAVSTAKFNNSITSTLLNLDVKLDEYQKNDDDKYILVDISNEKYFDKIVDKSNIIEIIDHHIGFEEYWKNKLGEKSHIEFIGSVATIIVELYEKNNILDKMSKEIAVLLMCAILDNTLNFKAKVTTRKG